MIAGLVALLLVVAVGCGSPPPPYKELRVYSKTLVGHTHIDLGDGRFWVASTQDASGYTERLREYTLLRSAELARDAGYTHFQVVAGTDTAAELVPPYRVVEPDLWNVIVCYSGSPPAQGTSWEVDAVIRRVRERYRIGPAQ